MRLAMAISPSRDNNSTDPISRKYIRTGSSELLTSPSDRLPDCGVSVVSSVSRSTSSAASTTFTPISLREAITSSIFSEVSSPCGKAAFSSSCVTKPRSLPFLISALIAVFLVSRIGASLFCSCASTVAFFADLRAILFFPQKAFCLWFSCGCYVPVPRVWFCAISDPKSRSKFLSLLLPSSQRSPV